MKKKKEKEQIKYLIQHKEFKNYYAGSKKLEDDDTHFHMVKRKVEATRLTKREATSLLNKKTYPKRYKIIEVKNDCKR